jgi:hypothetical protein
MLKFKIKTKPENQKQIRKNYQRSFLGRSGPKRVKLLFSGHSIKRAFQRSNITILAVIEFLKNQDFLTINKMGKCYEITIPMKGRFVGEFQDFETFIVKSFISLIFRFRSKSRQKLLIQISEIQIPWRIIPEHEQRKQYSCG